MTTEKEKRHLLWTKAKDEMNFEVRRCFLSQNFSFYCWRWKSCFFFEPTQDAQSNCFRWKDHQSAVVTNLKKYSNKVFFRGNKSETKQQIPLRATAFSNHVNEAKVQNSFKGNASSQRQTDVQAVAEKSFFSSLVSQENKTWWEREGERDWSLLSLLLFPCSVWTFTGRTHVVESSFCWREDIHHCRSVSSDAAKCDFPCSVNFWP